MIRTVQISDYQLVQGEFVKEAANGQICVQVFGRVYVGQPVELYRRGARPVASVIGQWDEVRRAG